MDYPGTVIDESGQNWVSVNSQVLSFREQTKHRRCQIKQIYMESPRDPVLDSLEKYKINSETMNALAIFIIFPVAFDLFFHSPIFLKLEIS